MKNIPPRLGEFQRIRYHSYKQVNRLCISTFIRRAQKFLFVFGNFAGMADITRKVFIGDVGKKKIASVFLLQPSVICPKTGLITFSGRE